MGRGHREGKNSWGCGPWRQGALPSASVIGSGLKGGGAPLELQGARGSGRGQGRRRTNRRAARDRRGPTLTALQASGTDLTPLSLSRSPPPPPPPSPPRPRSDWATCLAGGPRPEPRAVLRLRTVVAGGGGGRPRQRRREASAVEAAVGVGVGVGPAAPGPPGVGGPVHSGDEGTRGRWVIQTTRSSWCRKPKSPLSLGDEATPLRFSREPK